MSDRSQIAGRFVGARCLVTGAAGFIGSAVCSALLDCGAEVHGTHHKQMALSGRASWHVCDVADARQVEATFDAVRPDYVFHLAGKVSGGQSLDLVGPTLAVNLIGTIHVMTEAVKRSCKQVISLGSLQEPDQLLPPIPSSPYGAAKFAATAYANMFAEIFGLHVVIARPFMVYGAGQSDWSKLVPYVITNLLQGKTARLSSGLHEFDWVYIDDVVDALLCIAGTPGLSGKKIDIGCGALHSVRHVATELAAIVGRRDCLQLDAIPDRRLEPTRVADTMATTRLLGWKARVPLHEGLQKTVLWYRENGFH